MTTLATPYKYSQGYITYQLPMLPGLPDQVQVAGRTYRIKDELHVSLVKVLPATDQIAERDHLTLEAAEEVTSAVCFAGISKVKPEFDHYLNDVRLVDQPKRDRHTIVVMAKVTGLADFFDEINHELKLDLPVQVPHVSLFLENDLPIGITSPEALRKLTKPLTGADRAEFTRQVDPQKVFGWSAFK